MGVYIELLDVHDSFGHAFHCVDRIGREKIIFNFTLLIDFKIFVQDRETDVAEWFYGQVLIKNLTSKGEGHELDIAITHWKHDIRPKGKYYHCYLMYRYTCMYVCMYVCIFILLSFCHGYDCCTVSLSAPPENVHTYTYKHTHTYIHVYVCISFHS